MAMIVVTGATGFIGRTVGRQLTEAGLAWVGLGQTRIVGSPGRPETTAETAFRWERGRIVRLFGQIRPNAVIHLAGPALSGPATGVEGHRSALEDVLSACAAAGNRPRFVFGSSAAVYGPRSSSRPMEETEMPAPASAYGAAKAACEVRLLTAGERGDVDPLCARIFNVVGPGQREGMLHDLVTQLFPLPRVGNAVSVTMRSLKPVRDYVDVRDVAAWLVGLVRLSDLPPEVTLNLSAGRAISVGGMAEAVAETIDRPIIARESEARSAVDYAVGCTRRRRQTLPDTPLVPLRKSIADLLAMHQPEAA